MKLHSLLSVTVLALLLASCSSSSPVDSDLDASSDTAIAEPLADGENGTDESDLEGELDESSQSNEIDLDEQIDENAGVVESDNSDQNTSTEDDSDENNNDIPDQNLDPDPVIDPDSSLGQLQSRVQLLTGESLLRLNEAISSGELLTEQQENCIGVFDPALGEPLLAIDCDQPLSVNGVPIYASVAAFTDTPQCRASLQNGNADNCSVSQAQLTVNTLWTVPDPAIGQVIQRPQPTVGANIQYAIEPDKLLVENLDSALSGVYSCEYDLSTGLSIGTSAGSNCDLQFNNLVDLIDMHLADVI